MAKNRLKYGQFYRLSPFYYRSSSKTRHSSGMGVWGIVSFFGCVIVHLSKTSAQRKGVAVKELQILAIVALVTGFVWGAIGIIGQDAGLVQLSAIIAAIGGIAAILSVLFIEE